MLVLEIATPYGDVADGIRGLFGRDPSTGEPVSQGERAEALTMAAATFGPGIVAKRLRKGQKALELVDGAVEVERAADRTEGATRSWRSGAHHGKKPGYENPGHHDRSSPNFRGGASKTTSLPDDAESVFSRAIPDPDNPGTWYGRNGGGDYYRYQGSNGAVHWNGTTNSDRGLKVPSYIKKRFEALE